MLLLGLLGGNLGEVSTTNLLGGALGVLHLAGSGVVDAKTAAIDDNLLELLKGELGGLDVDKLGVGEAAGLASAAIPLSVPDSPFLRKFPLPVHGDPDVEAVLDILEDLNEVGILNLVGQVANVEAVGSRDSRLLVLGAGVVDEDPAVHELGRVEGLADTHGRLDISKLDEAVAAGLLARYSGKTKLPRYPAVRN